MSNTERKADWNKCGAAERNKCCIHLIFDKEDLVKCIYPQKEYPKNPLSLAMYNPDNHNYNYPDCMGKRLDI